MVNAPLKWLWARLTEIAAMELDREELFMKLGAARSFALDRAKLRQVRRREGRYLLRTNLCGKDPAELWRIQLVEIEAAVKNLKDDLRLRPIYHQCEQRIEAHIFIAFLAIACTSRCAHASGR